jgi:hypothetical protein
MERKEMMLAATISLARDARRDRLLIKYGFCTSDFGARAGVLGLVMGGGDKGGDVVRSTRRIIRRFCTKFSHPPRWYSGPEPSFNEDLYLGIPKPLKSQTPWKRRSFPKKVELLEISYFQDWAKYINIP